MKFGANDLSTPAYELQPVINVAAVCSSTQSLGPGLRSAVWVQGCGLRCPGCIAPDWIPMRPARLVDPQALADELTSNPQVTGITLSGGEPMLQASALAVMVRAARRIRDVSIICFTGYRLEQLSSHPPVVGVEDLLGEVDVLIDGPYIAEKNDNVGLRGSANQRIHHLTNRLRYEDFNSLERRVEINIQQGHAFLVGIPSKSMFSAFEQAMVKMGQKWPKRKVSYERV